jgi:hypothetical protein
MAGRYVGFGKKLFDLARGGGKSNVSTTIVGVDVAKNLATKRKIQDNVTEAVDSAFKKADLPPSVRDSIETKNKKAALKRDEGKKLKGLSYKLDKLEEKVKKKFNKGGRVGLKGGSGFPDLNKDGETTFADVLIGRGVIPKNKKNKKKMVAKKSKTPMQKAIKKDKKRII